MSAAPRTQATPTVADVAFPDGREGLFGVRDTSPVRAALTAFALAGMALRDEPVPVLATPPEGDADGRAVPVVGDVVGSIRAARLGELVDEAPDDLISEYLGPIPPAVDGELPVTEAMERIGEHEIALVVRRDEVIGVVERSALAAAIRPLQPPSTGPDLDG